MKDRSKQRVVLRVTASTSTSNSSKTDMDDREEFNEVNSDYVNSDVFEEDKASTQMRDPLLRE